MSIFPRGAGEFVSMVSGMILIFNTPFYLKQCKPNISLGIQAKKKKYVQKICGETDSISLNPRQCVGLQRGAFLWDFQG